MAKHKVTVKSYAAVFLALLALTGLTVWVAFLDVGAYAAPLALGIAATKATLVILFFMHVKYESRLIGLYAASGFVFVAILIVMTLGEMAGRRPQPPDALAPTPAAATKR